MRVIAGIAGGRRLKTIKGMSTRPTADMVKEAIFNIIAVKVAGSKVLDLYAGSGGLGIEALSRGAGSCAFVDNNPACCAMIMDNLKTTGLGENAAVIKSDANDAIARLSNENAEFDIILLDPPYYKNIVDSALNNICKNDIISDVGMIVTERHKKDRVLVVPDKLVLISERCYGDTVISIYGMRGYQN